MRGGGGHQPVSSEWFSPPTMSAGQQGPQCGGGFYSKWLVAGNYYHDILSLRALS